MTRHDTLKCVHEPFGDAFYFGPERLSTRYEQDEQARVSSGFSASTFKTVFERLEKESLEVGPFPVITMLRSPLLSPLQLKWELDGPKMRLLY
jgi:hypothetical protein